MRYSLRQMLVCTVATALIMAWLRYVPFYNMTVDEFSESFCSGFSGGPDETWRLGGMDWDHDGIVDSRFAEAGRKVPAKIPTILGVVARSLVELIRWVIAPIAIPVGWLAFHERCRVKA